MSSLSEARQCFFFDGDEVRCGARSLFARQLDDESTWYLVDGQSPICCDAFTLLASSPAPDIYKEFLKLENTTMRLMPVWSLAEVEACRSVCFPWLTLDEVTILCGKWGGIPRYVLQNAKDPFHQMSLDSAVSSSDIQKVIRSVGELIGADDASHKIIHIIVGHDFITRHINFASPYVSQQVALRYASVQKADLRDFLSASIALGPFGALRGNLFEG